MKRKYFGTTAGMMAMIFLLTGCGGSLPDMTLEQEEAIGEYAAVMLLKYDANNRSRLVDLPAVEEQEVLPETPVQTPVPEPEGMKPTADTPVVELHSQPENSAAESMEEFFEFPSGVTITYQGASVCQSYPETTDTKNYFGLDAADGKSLLVMEFIVTNQAETDVEINILDEKNQYVVTVNGETTCNVLTTLLMNDLSTYMDTVKAGESVSTVLLVEMNREKLNSVSEISLKLKNESKVYTIQLQ